MIKADETLKLRCVNHHVYFHYDAKGIHLKCRHCKAIETRTWEDLQDMRREAQKTDIIPNPQLLVRRH